MGRRRRIVWWKVAVSLLLLPSVWAGFGALGGILAQARGVDLVWAPILGGALCWVVILCLLPEPMWIYVLGHEVTHALWAWLFGSRVKKIKVTSKGGYVLVSKSNFLITLAPYFFPFYAVLAGLGYWVGNLVWDWRAFDAVFHLLLGLTYAFHVTMTVSVLRTTQPDIAEEGWIFSGVVIALGNLVVLMLSIPVLTGVSMLKGFLAWGRGTYDVWLWFLQF